MVVVRNKYKPGFPEKQEIGFFWNRRRGAAEFGAFGLQRIPCQPGGRLLG